jgi:hypothetical protein
MMQVNSSITADVDADDLEQHLNLTNCQKLAGVKAELK